MWNTTLDKIRNNLDDFVKGYRLEIYRREALRWPWALLIRFSVGQTLDAYEHLSKVFGISVPKVVFNGRGGGRYLSDKKTIRLTRNDLHFSIVAHEYAHHLAQNRRRHRIGHSKVFWLALVRVYDEMSKWHSDMCQVEAQNLWKLSTADLNDSGFDRA